MVKTLNYYPQPPLTTGFKIPITILHHFGKRMKFLTVYKPNVAKTVHISILHFLCTRIKH